MKVKVCGMTRPEQVLQLDEYGVDFAGFIFYPGSPRHVSNHLQDKEIGSIKVRLQKVGVFVNYSIEDILRKVDTCGFGLVQLHGDESPEFCNAIQKHLPVIRSISVSHEINNGQLKEYEEACDYFLFDTATKGYGGSGRKFDRALLSNATISKPYFISGGIQPQDASNLNRSAFAVDLNSRFEITPGVKDMNKIKTFYDTLSTT